MAVAGNPGATLQSVKNAGNTIVEENTASTHESIKICAGTSAVKCLMLHTYGNDGLFSIYQNNTTRWSFQAAAVSYHNSTAGFVFGSSSLTPSARLELVSTSAGFLPPRMTTAQRNAIASPAEGLQVYDLTEHKSYEYDGTSWQAMR